MTFPWKLAVTILLIGVFVAVRFALRASECLDGDEIFSLQLARLSWAQLWERAAHDVSHPPLFYALLKLWISLGGESLAWLRLLPAVTAILALVPFWGLCNALEIRWEEKHLTLALMVLNGYLLSYSLQLRMFSLLWLTSLFSLWAFASWLKAESPGWRVFTGFLMANLFVVYSHYWGWVLVGCQGLYVLVFTIRKLQQFSLIAGILMLAYLPWAQAVVEGAAKMGSFTSQIAWIGRPTIYDLTWFYSTLQGGLPIRHTTFLGLSLSGIPVFLWAWAVIKYRERAESFRFLTWFALFPVFLTFVMSQVLNQSVWAERSLIICAVPYLLLISVAACRLPGKAGLAVPLVLMIWAMVAGTDYVSKPHKLPWDSLITRLAQTEAQTPVAIYTLEDFVATPLQFYAIEEEVLSRENLLKALERVVKNQGAPGIDGMTVDELEAWCRRHWPALKEVLLSDQYVPSPVRKVEIPKAGGGMRQLGIPTVVDRLIQQALSQALTPHYDPTFSDSSFGYRPGRSAHQALDRAKEHIGSGHRWVVDVDLERFFDRVNHDVLMSRLARRIKDKRILKLIRRFLQAGIMEGGIVSPRVEGTPQGSPLSPLLSNILLDEWDKELEQRGHRFVRYADDCNIYVRSQAAGERVLASVERFLLKRLRLKINRDKSAVSRP